MLILAILLTLFSSATCASGGLAHDSVSDAVHPKQYITLVIDRMGGIVCEQECEILADGCISIKLSRRRVISEFIEFDPKNTRKFSKQLTFDESGKLIWIEHCLSQKTNAASEDPVPIGEFEPGGVYYLTLVSLEDKKVLQEGERMFPELRDHHTGGRTNDPGWPIINGSSGDSFSGTYPNRIYSKSSEQSSMAAGLDKTTKHPDSQESSGVSSTSKPWHQHSFPRTLDITSDLLTPEDRSVVQNTFNTSPERPAIADLD